MNYQIKLIYSNICYAMLRNINHNFFSISFGLENDNVQVKIILFDKGLAEENQIEDFIGELSSIAESNTILEPIITTDLKEEKLEYIVYELDQ